MGWNGRVAKYIGIGLGAFEVLVYGKTRKFIRMVDCGLGT
jgi:hypothetical protein